MMTAMSDARFRQTMRERYGIDIGEHGIYAGEALRLLFAEPVRHDHDHAAVRFVILLSMFGGIGIGIALALIAIKVFGG
jgi:hypothetical protein